MRLIIALVAVSVMAAPAAADQRRNVEIADAMMLVQGPGWERTYLLWGAAGVARINVLMPLAARKVIETGQCDRLDHIGISDSRSNPPARIVYFANCRNGRQFHVDEHSIKLGR